MMKRAILTAALVLLAAAVASAATIAPGETRTVAGTVAALEVPLGTLVVEAPVAAGSLTVGVVMDEAATLMRGRAAIGLGDLRIGEQVTLTYTRRGDRLFGLKVKAR